MRLRRFVLVVGRLFSRFRRLLEHPSRFDEFQTVLLGHAVQQSLEVRISVVAQLRADLFIRRVDVARRAGGASRIRCLFFFFFWWAVFENEDRAYC